MVAHLFHDPDIYFLLTGTFIFDFYLMPISFHTPFIANTTCSCQYLKRASIYVAVMFPDYLKQPLMQ